MKVKRISEQTHDTGPGIDTIEELESRNAPAMEAGFQFVGSLTYTQPFLSPPTRFPGDCPINHNETLVADTD